MGQIFLKISIVLIYQTKTVIGLIIITIMTIVLKISIHYYQDQNEVDIITTVIITTRLNI